MKKKTIIEVWYNWFAMPEHDAFTKVTIGDIYETTHGILKCVGIKESIKDNYHIDIEFEDGSVERQWNINKLIYDGEAKSTDQT